MTVAAPKASAVLLPERSANEAALRKVLADASLSSSSEGAEIAVVDVTGDDGFVAIEKLRAQIQSGALSLIAVIDSEATAQKAIAAGASDVVHVSRMEMELPGRMSLVQARHAVRAEARKREKDLALLLQLTATYASSLDPEALLHDVTRRLATEMDIERAALIVLDEQQNAGFIIAASDDAALKDLRIELSRYPEIREVARTNKPVIVEDAPSHPLLEGVKENIAARGIHAIAALPLAVQGKVLGVLLLRASSRRKAFSMREIDFLATVAHATAVALRNARLLEGMRGQTEREKTARIAAEERAASLSRYEAYFASVSDGVALLDAKACLISINPAACQMLDVLAHEARGRHINAITNPADDGVLIDMLWSVSRGETRRDVDLAVRTLAGRRLTLSVSAAPLREGDATAIVSFRDVTAARTMAEELSKTKEFLEKLINSSVDAIIAADMKGRIILFNKGAEEICGYTADEARERLNVRDLYPTNIAREVMQKLREAKGRLGVSRQEIVTKNGERVPVNMTASIVYEGGREVATVGIFTDLRAWMQLERRLSETEDRLEESEKNAVIVALAGTAAHELNQPLTSVMGYAELLKRKLKETDYAYRPVDIIYREAERMAEIVRKIGKITRYETKAYIGSQKILDLDKASSHEE
ncbi:MAG: PAS domain S-box protein [Myxococcaceae bacterium]